jgi:hypothetical protein
MHHKLHDKQWEDPSAVATLSIVILLSPRINSSTQCTVASVAILTGQPVRVSSATFELLDSVVNRFTRQRLPTVNIYLWIYLHCVLLPTKKMHNRTLLFDSTRFKHVHQFDYWNQPLNMRMRLCYLGSFLLWKNCKYKKGIRNAHPARYLGCHEAGLCCYLVMQIENLLRPLQQFHFHLWHIYWISLVTVTFNIHETPCLQGLQFQSSCRKV